MPRWLRCAKGKGSFLVLLCLFTFPASSAENCTPSNPYLATNIKSQKQRNLDNPVPNHQRQRPVPGVTPSRRANGRVASPCTAHSIVWLLLGVCEPCDGGRTREPSRSQDCVRTWIAIFWRVWLRCQGIWGLAVGASRGLVGGVIGGCVGMSLIVGIFLGR
jgi:hypothetical protein